MEFGLLGPLVVRVEDSPVVVSAGKQRALLAALVLRANEVVPAGELARVVWDGRPPETARVTLQNYVKRLRQALGPAGYQRIVTRPAGYVLVAGPGEVDVARFRELVAAGRAAARSGRWEVASARLGAALGLWRGQPLADVPSGVLAAGVVPGLVVLRLDAVEARAEAELQLGRHREVVAELAALVAAEPLRERLAELLMVALYRSGQQAAALAVYRQTRRHLVDALGIEPGPGLRELNQQILRSDRTLLLPAQAVSGAPVPAAAERQSRETPRPNLLPAATPNFTGRSRELGKLRAQSVMLGRPGGPALITAIGGTAGVGKTALAVHWARRAAPEFPGGQLYVNLRGFGPADPLPATEALGAFLDALGVPAAQVPAGLDERQVLYRRLLTGKRVLIVLDNARDPAQVRPLLPGTPTAMVLITSRNEMASLVVADGATAISLDVLTAAEARAMLVQRLGAGRVAAEPEAAGELIALCARLPLALAITAARAAAHPGFTLAALAAELRDAKGRLDALSTGEDTTDVRAVLSWSYQQLSPATAQMFRLLGLHPGPEVTAPAAASLAGTGLPEASRMLRELTRCHLLAEPAPGRYAFHDLLRAYAVEQAAAEDSESERREATGRMLDHYLHTAHAAAVLINRHRQPLDLGPPRPGTAPERLDGHEQAMGWLAAEHQVLLAAIGLAAEAGFDVHAWQLPWALADYLQREGRWNDLAAIQAPALAAAERLGDTATQATVHLLLGQAGLKLRAWDRARTHLTRALELYAGLGNVVYQGRVHISLGAAMERQGRYREALDHASQALALSEQGGNQLGQARALNNVGWYHALLGDHRQALRQGRRALALLREIGDRCGEANTWDSLGYSHYLLGQHAKATSCYQRGASLFAEIGDRTSQAETLVHLGDRHFAAGRPRAAAGVWRQALRIFDELGHPYADEVRDKLSRAAAPASTAPQPTA